jgi:hypothetical protein
MEVRRNGGPHCHVVRPAAGAASTPAHAIGVRVVLNLDKSSDEVGR